LTDRKALLRAQVRNHPIKRSEGPMTARTTSPQTPSNSASSRTAVVLPAILFCVILVFAIVVTLRYAGGG
jgi:hypothetical protein